MAAIRIAVINQSTVVSDASAQPVVNALQTQVSRDFAPAWGIDAELLFVPTGSTPPANAWWLVILDDSDQGTEQGYHQLTAQGQPLAKVFARTSLNAGIQWTMAASHELLEMLADPDVNLSVFVQQHLVMGTIYFYEICDPCQHPQFSYQIDGIQVSDFVFPAWFQSAHSGGSTQFDFTNNIRQPFQIISGGYVSTFKVYFGGGWSQQHGMHASSVMPENDKTIIDERIFVRRLPRSKWQVSEERKVAAISPPKLVKEAKKKLKKKTSKT